MSFWVDPKVKYGNNKQYEFICYDEPDVDDLPTAEGEVEIGASALVIETANVYMLNSQRVWRPLGG